MYAAGTEGVVLLLGGDVSAVGFDLMTLSAAAGDHPRGEKSSSLKSASK